MSREQLSRMAGQMVLASPSKTTTDSEIIQLVEDCQIGGIILFARSCKNTDDIKQLNENLQRRAEIPLFVMIDQEGGRVMRIRESPFKLPSARIMAEKSPEEVGEMAFYLGRRLHEIGINCDLAPVLDVDSNPDNPIIGDRAFGSNVDTVFKYADAFYKGLEKADVLGCGKHFPGHGDTDQDSHLTLPVVKHAHDRLNDVEIEPFSRAIGAGFDMLMVAHVLYPALDSEFPASMSAKICSDLLRNSLKFNGVIMADDLEMKAISATYDTENIVYHMLLAGIDLLPVCSDYELAKDVHRSIIKLVNTGKITEKRIKSSFERVIKLKRKFAILEDSIL